MTKEENDLLVKTGPGTPCGDMMRRYWQPAALSEDLPAGGAPLPVRLLGEDLVMFRDQQGRPGLLDVHCSHRGADLSYGRVEDGGLRCIYHGWLYDIKGRCLDQPGEPEGGKHREEIRQRAYPCTERSGVIFAYLGPGEPPLLPNYEFLTVPEQQVFAIKLYHSCNYLQGNEGNFDPIHVSFLHYTDRGSRSSADQFTELCSRGLSPTLETVELELVDFGVRTCKVKKVGPDKHDLRYQNFVLPSLATFPGGQQGWGGYSCNWHVPIDDTHHWKYTFTFNREKPLDKELMRRGRADMTADFKPIRNRENRYQQDRETMKSECYSGIGYNFQIHDLCVTEGMGAIQDRTLEHLVSSDRGIVAQRKVLLKAIQDVQEGRDPAHVIRDPELNRFPHMVVYSAVVPTSTTWKDYCEQLIAEGRA